MFFVKMFQIPQMFLPETFQIPQMFYILSGCGKYRLQNVSFLGSSLLFINELVMMIKFSKIKLKVY